MPGPHPHALCAPRMCLPKDDSAPEIATGSSGSTPYFLPAATNTLPSPASGDACPFRNWSMTAASSTGSLPLELRDLGPVGDERGEDPGDVVLGAAVHERVGVRLQHLVGGVGEVRRVRDRRARQVLPVERVHEPGLLRAGQRRLLLPRRLRVPVAAVLD